MAPQKLRRASTMGAFENAKAHVVRHKAHEIIKKFGADAGRSKMK